MRGSIALMLSLSAVAAFGQEARQIPITVGQAVPKIMELKSRAHASAMQPKPDVILFDFPNTALIIPVSGNLAGNFGTYFRSDVTIANLRNAPQTVAVGYLQSGKDNTNEPLRLIQFNAGAIVTFRDFVGTTLQKTGLGSLLIFASDSQGNLDADGEIDAYSRIWTPQPGSTGEVSQNFDAVDPNDLIGNGITYILGLRQDSRFRSNVGIVNLGTATHTWTATSLSSGASVSVTVPPYSVTQTGIAAGSGNSDGFVQLGLSTDSSESWSAYGTTNDNTTGDGWVSRAKRFIP